MNLKEYAEQAVPLLQAVLKGKELEARPRASSPEYEPKWVAVGAHDSHFQHFSFGLYEYRVKIEGPESVLVHVYEDGSAGFAFGPNEAVPVIGKGRMVRYVREDLVQKEQALAEDRRTYGDYIVFR